MKRLIAIALVLSAAAFVVFAGIGGLDQGLASTSQECRANLFVISYQSGLRQEPLLEGVMRIEIDEEGGINGDVISTEDARERSGITLARVVGQANGYSVDLAFDRTLQAMDSDGTPVFVQYPDGLGTIFAMGVGQRPIRNCSGTWGGLFVSRTPMWRTNGEWFASTISE